MEPVNPPVGSATDSAHSSVPEPESLRGRIVSLLVVAAWLGLLSGILHVVTLAVRRYAFDHLVKRSPEVIWMAPLSQLLVFLALAIVILPFVVGAGRQRSTAIGVAIFTFLGAFSLLLPFGTISRWAMALIAIGITVQTVRWYARNPKRRRRQMARGAAILAGVVLLVGIGQQIWGMVTTRVALSRLPVADSTAPNVLILLLDTVRRDHLGLHGYPGPNTPELEKWARESTVFDDAIATAPWTLPSHGTLFTGEYPDRLTGSFLTPMHFKTAPLAEVLQRRGYRTAGFVANLIYLTPETGITRGFTEFDHFPTSLDQVFLHNPLAQTQMIRRVVQSNSLYQARSAILDFNLRITDAPVSDRKAADVIADNFLRWQRGLPKGPFFAFLNFMDAHGPPGPPERFRKLFPPRGQVNRYDAAIAHLDFEIDRILQELKRQGILDRTIVVVTSDHGEQFGEHGLDNHHNSLYHEVIEVPLLIRYPGRVPAGVRVPAPVSLRDVGSTILDLASVPDAASFPGSSLTPLIGGQGTGEPRSPALSELDKGINLPENFRNSKTWVKSVLDDRYHYIRDGFGGEELFDRISDHQELTNLVKDGNHQAGLLAMRRLMDSLIATGGRK